jgi:hypothetical protein
MKEMHPITTSLAIRMKGLKIPKGQSEDVTAIRKRFFTKESIVLAIAEFDIYVFLSVTKLN